MVSPERAANVIFFSGVTSLIGGDFIVQAVRCVGGAGILKDYFGNVIADFSSEGSIEFYKKFDCRGLVKTGGALSDMYVYLDASDSGG